MTGQKRVESQTNQNHGLVLLGNLPVVFSTALAKSASIAADNRRMAEVGVDAIEATVCIEQINFGEK